jgi:hypothetical protein
MLLVEGLPRHVAGGEITMRVIPRVTDLLESIQQDMDVGRIIGVTHRRSQDHLRDGLGQREREGWTEHQQTTFLEETVRTDA